MKGNTWVAFEKILGEEEEISPNGIQAEYVSGRGNGKCKGWSQELGLET